MSASPFFLISSKYISTYLGFPSTQNHSMLAAHRIRPAWLSQVWALVEPYQAPDQMSVLTDKWRNFFTTLSFSQLFEPPTIREDWPAIVHRTDEQVIQGAMSSSMLAVQDDETKKAGSGAIRRDYAEGGKERSGLTRRMGSLSLRITPWWLLRERRGSSR